MRGWARPFCSSKSVTAIVLQLWTVKGNCVEPTDNDDDDDDDDDNDSVTLSLTHTLAQKSKDMKHPPLESCVSFVG